MGILQDKIAVITGSTRGFGLAIARAYAREGASVVISSRSSNTVDEIVTELANIGVKAAGFPCDVRHLDQVQALADNTIQVFGHIDVWVNNAALSPPYGPTIHVPIDSFVNTTLANVLGTYYGSVVAMRYFLSRGSGKLINILGRGERSPQTMQNAYASSKAWMRSFTMALAKEYKDSGVGVYAFNPGMMDTEMLQSVKVISGYEKRVEMLETIMAILSQPPEIPAEKAVWLASSATDKRTGLILREMSTVKIMRNFLREGANRLLKRPRRPIDVQITQIPAEFSIESDNV